MTTLQQLQLWGQLNEAPPADVVTFVRRVFEKTRAYEERVFYFPSTCRLFSVYGPRVWDWRPFAFRIRPANLLPEYRKRPVRPNTFFVDRVTFNHRRGMFYHEGLCGSRLSDLCDSAVKRWRGSTLYVTHARVSAEQIALLKEACDTVELHIPGGRVVAPKAVG